MEGLPRIPVPSSKHFAVLIICPLKLCWAGLDLFSEPCVVSAPREGTEVELHAGLQIAVQPVKGLWVGVVILPIAEVGG